MSEQSEAGMTHVREPTPHWFITVAQVLVSIIAIVLAFDGVWYGDYEMGLALLVPLGFLIIDPRSRRVVLGDRDA